MALVRERVPPGNCPVVLDQGRRLGGGQGQGEGAVEGERRVDPQFELVVIRSKTDGIDGVLDAPTSNVFPGEILPIGLPESAESYPSKVPLAPIVTSAPKASVGGMVGVVKEPSSVVPSLKTPGP